MTFYLAGAGVVFSVLLNAFVKDNTTPKTHKMSWVLLIVATLIWPLVVPSIVSKKMRRQPEEVNENTALELS